MTNYSKLNNYINFTDKFEMNEHVTAHRQAHCYDLNDTDKHLLTYVSRYACRYVGVAYLKVSTMCKFLGKSESTIKRSLCKLGELGIIKKIRTTRLKGGFGANILQIQQFNELSNVNGCTNKNNPSIHCESKHESNTGETKPFYSQSKNNLLKETYATQVVKDNQSIKLDRKDMTPYQQLKQFVSYFVNDNKLVYKVYGIWLSQTKKALKTNATGFKMDVDLLLRAIRVTMQSYKEGKTSNITGYFSGVLSNILTKETSVDSDLAVVSAPAAHTITVNQRTELIPSWWNDRNTRNDNNGNNTVVEPSLAPTVDFEAEKARVLAKIKALKHTDQHE